MIPNTPELKDLRDRLYNWKFNSALECAIKTLEDLGDDQDNIAALARLFGNCGWIEGDMGVLISIAVHSLIGNDSD